MWVRGSRSDPCWPSGTGKTLLAKAVSVRPVSRSSPSPDPDFVEMFVGVGASRVRDLFEDAKKTRRASSLSTRSMPLRDAAVPVWAADYDEREQTLNQLLVEMDGFLASMKEFIVMAATNRVDILDPAILRPGRFDRKIGVENRISRGREEILKVHLKEKPLGDDVDFREWHRPQPDFTGADLENLLNEGRQFSLQSSPAAIFSRPISGIRH